MRVVAFGADAGGQQNRPGAFARSSSLGSRQLCSTTPSLPVTIQMRFQETSAKTAANVDATIEDMLTDIMEKGLPESKEKKGVTLGEEVGRSQSDSCCT